MIEIDPSVSAKETKSYDFLDFVVYDVVDLYPRGSLYDVSKIDPPYLISPAPLDITSVEHIIAKVLSVNPASRIRQEVDFLAERYEGEELVKRLEERLPPEKMSRILNLNFLRAKFGTRLERGEDLYRPGDKIAIIKRPGRYSYFLLVDLTIGKYVSVESWKEMENRDLSPYMNERLKELPRTATRQKREPFSYDFEELLAEGDVETRSRLANDEGKRKYTKETRRFFNRMYQADLEVEYTLIEEIDRVVPVTKAIQRLGKRIGRDKTIALIKAIRIDGWKGGEKTLDDLHRDIIYASSLDKETEPVSVSEDEIKNVFRLLFKAESLYLTAILDFPWNKTGPEPFDTLINVFWFRFAWSHLQFSWKHKEKGVAKLKSEFYKRAQIDRILTWANQTHSDLNACYLKDLEEIGITYDMKEVERVAGPLYRYFNGDGLKDIVYRRQRRSRPNELTLLLWRSLKWASTSQWKDSRTIMSSDLRYIDDPLTWVEKIPDPEWEEIGDNHGRLTLVGESMSVPLSHLKSNKGVRMTQLERELAFEMELSGDISMSDVVQKKQKEMRKKVPKSFDSVARDFIGVVSQLSVADLIDKISKLNLIQQLIVWQRLGYFVQGGNILKNYYYNSFTSFDIAHIVKFGFGGKPYRYYHELRKIADILSGSESQV